MSLNRVISLESWDYRPSSFRHRERPNLDHGDNASAEEREENDSFSNARTRLAQVRPADSQNSVRRKLSFNPAAGPPWTHATVDDDGDDDDDNDDDQDEECQRSLLSISDDDSALMPNDTGSDGSDTLAAFEIPRWKRIAQVTVAVLNCLLSAGVIFGYAALKPILVEEGVYRNRCSKEELDRGESLCYNQDLRLNFMFTLSAVATNISALPVGSILDTFGPRFSGSIGSILIALGSLCLALASLLPFDTYVAGFFLLALGGPFVFISAFQLSNTFPTHSGLILAILTGAFDSSSAIFLLFRILHGGFFTLRNLFLMYLIVPAVILASQILLMPSTSYKTAGELIQQKEDVIAENATDGPPEGSLSRMKARRSNSVWGVLHMASALQQIRSPYFILMTSFAILQMLRINYFIASIGLQYESLLSSPQLANHLNHLFDLFLPLAGIVAIPFTGLILDRASTVTAVATLVCFSTLVGILGCIPHSLLAAYANVTLFTLYRPFCYASISDYAAKVFGFQTFGKVYGLMICLAGLGNFLQLPLDILTMKLFRRDPIPVNILLTIVVFVAGGILVLFVWWRGRERMGIVDVVVENGELGGVHSVRHAPSRKRRSRREIGRSVDLGEDDSDGGPSERDRLLTASHREDGNGSACVYLV
ncbi:hypothetical protein PAAG_12279 [Paracoccidioides lutzii Pb01]|uniref:MFS transporter Fmp42 n=1 Tax=Paracoccidioides lutzii (strain ATCC MYA-826 / Pb01) TaxID=502779 RepID=A0A0A2V0J8_PARBA|nr:hypothetical protein PAAG_12279 [Paracoccidioides lutzii Pb01]KGQ01028.1 hypothetical protein PAAG_12279 [Paracoccidioides lutzii Pb01]